MQDSPEMVAWIQLVLCNFPVYLFLAWVLFDSAENACIAATFGEAYLLNKVFTKLFPMPEGWS